MKRDYDFSEAERGESYGKDAALDLPVYPETDGRDYLTERAKDNGVDANELLKCCIELIVAAK
jgi:hypothetical protein